MNTIHSRIFPTAGRLVVLLALLSAAAGIFVVVAPTHL
jgi:hypothetical protein